MPELTDAEWRRFDATGEDLNLFLKRLKKKYPNVCIQATSWGELMILVDPSHSAEEALGWIEIENLSIHSGTKPDHRGETV